LLTQDDLTQAAKPVLERLDSEPPEADKPRETTVTEPLVTLGYTPERSRLFTSAPSISDARQIVDCLGTCAMDQLGVSDIIALGGVVLGAPIIPKPKPGALRSGKEHPFYQELSARYL